MSEVSKEYGAALFMLACEKDSKNEYLKALETVAEVFRENPQYLEFLSSVSIPKNERLSAIGSAFSGRLFEDVVSFLQLMCEKGRINGFFEAFEEFKNLFDISESVKNIKVTSAVELSDEEKSKLKQKLEKKDNCMVNIEYFIDKSLLGGMIIEACGKIIDGSLKTRLRDIKEVIST